MKSPSKFSSISSVRHPNRVLARSMIVEHVCDYDFPNVMHVIDFHIRWLPKKLDVRYRRLESNCIEPDLCSALYLQAPAVHFVAWTLHAQPVTKHRRR